MIWPPGHGGVKAVENRNPTPLQHRLKIALSLAALCAALAGVVPSTAGQLDGKAQVITVALANSVPGDDANAAEEARGDALFADAPYGVDPVVTGPVSAAFKKKRAELRCDDAVWPDVPGACYPD